MNEGVASSIQQNEDELPPHHCLKELNKMTSHITSRRISTVSYTFQHKVRFTMRGGDILLREVSPAIMHLKNLNDYSFSLSIILATN